MFGRDSVPKIEAMHMGRCPKTHDIEDIQGKVQIFTLLRKVTGGHCRLLSIKYNVPTDVIPAKTIADILRHSTLSLES
jgi:hypothetical protein